MWPLWEVEQLTWVCMYLYCTLKFTAWGVSLEVLQPDHLEAALLIFDNNIVIL